MASQDWRRQMEESNRRFYKNINEIRLQRGLPPVSHPSLRLENEENDRSIFIKIHLERYSISSEILDQVFSRFGVLEIIEILSPPMGFHSKIRFENKQSVIQAFDSLDGRNIYDNCCTLELFLVKDSATRPSDSVGEEPIQELELEGSEQETELEVLTESSTPLASPQMVADGNEPGPVFVKGCCWNFGESEPEFTGEQLNEVKETTSPPKDINQEIDGILEDHLVPSASLMENELKKAPKPEPQTQHNHLKVTSNPCSAMILDGPSKELCVLVVLLIELLEMRLANGRRESIDGLRTHSAHKVFVEMPSLVVDNSYLDLDTLNGVRITDIRVASEQHNCILARRKARKDILLVQFDKISIGVFKVQLKVVLYGCVVAEKMILIFDPGGHFDIIDCDDVYQRLMVENFVFDPGILGGMSYCHKMDEQVQEARLLEVVELYFTCRFKCNSWTTIQATNSACTLQLVLLINILLLHSFVCFHGCSAVYNLRLTLVTYEVPAAGTKSGQMLNCNCQFSLTALV